MPEKRFTYRRQRHVTGQQRIARTQLKTVEGAVRVLTWLAVMDKAERKQMELYLRREGMKRSLPELTQGGHALYANLHRKSAAEPPVIALKGREEAALMNDFRLLVKLFPKKAKKR